MVKSQLISWPFWSSRELGARGAGSGSIFGGPSLGKSKVGSLKMRIQHPRDEAQAQAKITN
jgi:hypothetical protein